MSGKSSKIVVSSSFSHALGMYVNCTEDEGSLIESHFSKEPEYEIADSGVSRLIADYLDGKVTDLSNVKYRLEGTDFQVQVWKELAKIPRGSTVSYGEIARRVSRPKSSRAVGNAVGSNKLTIVIPCHRVVAANGFGGYSAEGGIKTKRKILEIEGAL